MVRQSTEGVFMQKQPSKGFFKKDVVWIFAEFMCEFSQNSQENIYVGTYILVFYCEFCEIYMNNFFAEEHWTTASNYISNNSSEGSTVLINDTVNYDTKTKTYVLICARNVSY